MSESGSGLRQVAGRLSARGGAVPRSCRAAGTIGALLLFTVLACPPAHAQPEDLAASTNRILTLQGMLSASTPACEIVFQDRLLTDSGGVVGLPKPDTNRTQVFYGAWHEGDFALWELAQPPEPASPWSLTNIIFPSDGRSGRLFWHRSGKDVSTWVDENNKYGPFKPSLFPPPRESVVLGIAAKALCIYE
jgi:hypothetical protein